MRPARFSSAVAAIAFGAGSAPPHALAGESAETDEPGDTRANEGQRDESWLRSSRSNAAPSSERGGEVLEFPVATAFAASLSASQDTCMGSRSFGLQTIGFGVSVATTWPDRQCRRWRNARALDGLGYRRAALALLCQDEEVERAMERVGQPCPGPQMTNYQAPQVDEPEPPPLISFDDVLFDFDRSTLRPEANVILEPLLAMMQADAAMSIDIEGHTDWVGSDAYNQGLSQRRAQAVVEWLVAHGIARERIGAVGRGEAEPVASNETAAGRQLNRRVEIRRRAT